MATITITIKADFDFDNDSMACNMDVKSEGIKANRDIINEVLGSVLQSLNPDIED